MSGLRKLFTILRPRLCDAAMCDVLSNALTEGLNVPALRDSRGEGMIAAIARPHSKSRAIVRASAKISVMLLI